MDKKTKIGRIQKRGFHVTVMENEQRLRAQKGGLVILGTVNQVFFELFGDFETSFTNDRKCKRCKRKGTK